nr:hypothetical transcript [Hymenolepis microstoma]
MLCRVKRISPRETRSETSAPPAPQRPLRESRISLASSSSAPPHGPIKPRVAPVFQIERRRQLEKTVRDQEKIIIHLESELHRMRSQENRVRTPIRNCSGRSQNSQMNERDPSQDIPSRNSSQTFSSAKNQSSSMSSPPMEQDTSVPALARRIRSLVRDIREDTEASLARSERHQNHWRSSSLSIE